SWPAAASCRFAPRGVGPARAASNERQFAQPARERFENSRGSDGKELRLMTAVRFGKHPPKHDYRTLRLKNYLTSALAPPPASYDVLQRVYQRLDTSDPKALFPMDGNDALGDCTIAALAHATTAYHGLVGKRKIM